MRAERLLNIMILLQTQGKMTTKELSNKLEVSQRTILRDMDALSISGIPVFAERGKTGGWRLMDNFRSQLAGMKLEDMKSLFILPSDQMLEELGLLTGKLDIRQKLLASLPSATQNEAQNFLEKIYLDTGTWKPSKDVTSVLHSIQNALWQDKKLKIEYEKTNGNRSKRILCPLGLVLKGSVWYLVAMNDANEFRSFRVSRIIQVEMLSDCFTRPQHFSLPQYWKQSKLNFVESLPSIEVKVLAHKELLGRMLFTDKFVEQIHEDICSREQWVRLSLQFNTEQEAIEYIIGFGGRMKLLEPADMIPEIIQQAKSVIKMHE